MPPSNSPVIDTGATSRSQTPSRSFFAALREIESPVPDLAATLTTSSPEQEHNTYHRMPIDPQDEWRAENAANEEARAAELRRHWSRLRPREESDTRERLRYAMDQIRSRQEPAYSNRVPQRQSLYDWAPARSVSASDQDEDMDDAPGLSYAAAATAPIVPADWDARTRTWSQTASRPRPPRESMSRSRLSTSATILEAMNNRSHAPEPSLRSAALMQLGNRRHSRMPARERGTRDLGRYILERERAERERLQLGATSDSEERDGRHSTMSAGASIRWARRPRTPPSTNSRYESNRIAWQSTQHLDNSRSMRERLRSPEVTEAYTGWRDEERKKERAPGTPLLERSVRYLSEMRRSTSDKESLGFAIAEGVMPKGSDRDQFGPSWTEFIFNPEDLHPPTESSFLMPGVTFKGCQYGGMSGAAMDGLDRADWNLSPRRENIVARSTLYRLPNNQTITSTTFDPSLWSENDSERSRLSLSAIRRRLENEVSGTTSGLPHSPLADRWPVRVSIHAVDYENMTLSGIMEAFDVPAHPTSIIRSSNASRGSGHNVHTPSPSNPNSITTSPTSATTSPTSSSRIPSSISTYLEGEILDLRTHHTFLTESFASSATTDSTYWRKLSPFKDFTDDELASKLLSIDFLRRLQTEWIFMRWKERCFLRSKRRPAAPLAEGGRGASSTTGDWGTGAYESLRVNSNGDLEDSSGSGLTISGFYYVSMRRSDGEIEGLYYDPNSSPYQKLQLGVWKEGGLPAWELR